MPLNNQKKKKTVYFSTKLDFISTTKIYHEFLCAGLAGLFAHNDCVRGGIQHSQKKAQSTYSRR